MPKQVDVQLKRLPPCPWCGRSPSLMRRAVTTPSHIGRLMLVEEAIKLQCPWVHCATSTKEFLTNEDDWMSVTGAISPVDAAMREWRNRSVIIPLTVPLPELHFVRRRQAVGPSAGVLSQMPAHLLVVMVPYARSLAAHLLSYLQITLNDDAVTPLRFTLREHKIEHEVALLSMTYVADVRKRKQNWSSFTFLSRGMPLVVQTFNRGNVDVEWLKTKPPVPPIKVPGGNEADRTAHEEPA